MKGLKNKIREILDKPPKKEVKCGCNGKLVYKYREPDGPNASDWGRTIYGYCTKCDRNNMIIVEDTNKMIELIIKACTS